MSSGKNCWNVYYVLSNPTITKHKKALYLTNFDILLLMEINDTKWKSRIVNRAENCIHNMSFPPFICLVISSVMVTRIYIKATHTTQSSLLYMATWVEWGDSYRAKGIHNQTCLTIIPLYKIHESWSHWSALTLIKWSFVMTLVGQKRHLFLRKKPLKNCYLQKPKKADRQHHGRLLKHSWLSFLVQLTLSFSSSSKGYIAAGQSYLASHAVSHRPSCLAARPEGSFACTLAVFTHMPQKQEGVGVMCTYQEEFFQL